MPIKILNISCNSCFGNMLYSQKFYALYTKYLTVLYHTFHYFSSPLQHFHQKIKNKSPFVRATVIYCHRLTNRNPNFTVFAFFCLFGQGAGSTEKSGSQRQKLSPKLCNVSPETQQFFGCFVDFPSIRRTKNAQKNFLRACFRLPKRQNKTISRRKTQ